MYPNYTPEQFDVLYNTVSSADCGSVMSALQSLTEEPLTFDAPGDDAEFLTEFLVGEMKNPRKVVLIFSKRGNLCFGYFPDEPLIEASILEPVLNHCGWTLIPPSAASIVLCPATGARVIDCFFDYI